MTTSLSTRELSNVYTPATDDAPVVDGNGDPRFVAETEIANPDFMFVDELDEEIADWNAAADDYMREEFARRWSEYN